MKKMSLIKILLLFFFTVIFITCAKYKKNPVGSEFFDRDNMGKEKSCLIYASASDTFFKYTNIKTGHSTYLNIGAVPDHNIQAKSLIKFYTYLDSAQVDSASLTLYIHRFYGTPTGTFSCSIYKITQSWEEDSLNIENYDGGLQGEFIKDFTVSFDDSVKSFTVSLPKTLVQSWFDSTTSDDNYGLMFIPNNFQFITEFYSSESDSNQPELTIYVPADTDTTDLKYNFPSSDDLFLAEGNFESDTDFLYLTNGIASRSLLFFDVSTIPEQATINRALLNVYSDTTAAFPNWQDKYNISVFKISADSWTVPLVPLDSSTYTIIALDSTDSASANVTPYIQQWTLGMEENYGFLLKGINENTNLDYRRLYSSKADSSKKPSLKIFYSLPPEENLNN